jgi:YggT family protein
MSAVIQLVHWIFTLYSVAIIIRVLLSWLRVSYYHPVARFFIQITEPVLAPLRRYIPPMGGLDFTPMVALLILWIVERLVVLLLTLLF